MKKLCEKGVFFLNDIVDDSGVILDCTEINKKYDVHLNYLKF